MADSSARRVGVIGLGLMGSALADALLDKGVATVVWNRSAQKSERYIDTRATVSTSAEEAASLADLLVVCLSDYQVSMEVLQKGSVAANLKGKILLLFSTMSSDDSLRAEEWAVRSGIRYLDGSILGYPEDIRKQQCMVVYSGGKDLFESWARELNAMGGIARHIGDKAGIAPLFDKAIYSIYYAHYLGVAHGAAMCQAMGAPLDVYIESLTKYWDFASEGALFLERIKKQDYSVEECEMQVHAAAFSHVVTLSEKLGIDPSLPRVISDSLTRAVNSGFDKSELPAIVEVLRKR